MAHMNSTSYPGGNNDSSNASMDKSEQPSQQNTSDENPQQGGDWSNYQTRELSANEDSGLSAKEAAEVFEKDKS